ncbi:hypothetical protein CK203_096244 [Vitis vinifera]|uniref:Uncharacterized protein n=1 Tax=Vitis vinifera TaxID=29760 RepID=A0A438EEY9_VITVI|nr:hypothetical protein CK203_096244 [Vitis vinifera]
MLASTTLISCNFSALPFLSLKTRNPNSRISFIRTPNPNPPILSKPKHPISTFQKRGGLQICQSSFNTQNPEDPAAEKGAKLESENGDGGDGGDWTTSALLFVLWVGLIYYVFNLTPDQTPSRDVYFLKKLLNLKGDDGFRMNDVLVSLWYIMGLWPLVYSMLLLPTGRRVSLEWALFWTAIVRATAKEASRVLVVQLLLVESSKGKVPVWPFLTFSFFGGVYALLPYFVLWRPPPPPVEETELRRWPLNFLESKINCWGKKLFTENGTVSLISLLEKMQVNAITHQISLAAGLGIIIYAGLASGDDWKEFYQYYRESKFIHITSLDFTLLSAFAPFWVYNDMTARKWFLASSLITGSILGSCFVSSPPAIIVCNACFTEPKFIRAKMNFVFAGQCAAQ